MNLSKKIVRYTTFNSDNESVEFSQNSQISRTKPNPANQFSNGKISNT